MKGEFVRREEFEDEIQREDLLKHVPYFRRKGTRLLENPSGLCMFMKPGSPEQWARSMPNIHRFDKAHLVMLIEENLIPRKEGIRLLSTLREMDEEDVIEKRVQIGAGMFSGEQYLIQKYGEDVGGLIHLGRSTGDLITGGTRMGMRAGLIEIIAETLKYREALLDLAEEHIETPFPTYTGRQEAQTTSFAHYLLDYLYKANHACRKIIEAYREVNRSPMGAAIGTGSDFHLNRERVAELLGFDEVVINTHEAISNENKTFIIEAFNSFILFLSSVEKLCSFFSLFHSNEFNMIRTADRHSGTSSIMPQKRNALVLSSIAPSIHTVYSLFVLQLFDETALMSWPRGGPISSAIENVKISLIAATTIIRTLKINKDKIIEHLMTNWTCSADLAGALIREHKLSWRTAHQIVSILVRHAEERDVPAKELNNAMIEEASMEHMGKRLSLKEDTIRKVLDPLERIKARTLTGGPAPQNVKKQIQEVKQGLVEDREFMMTARKKLEDADRKLDRVVDKLCKELV